MPLKCRRHLLVPEREARLLKWRTHGVLSTVSVAADLRCRIWHSGRPALPWRVSEAIRMVCGARWPQEAEMYPAAELKLVACSVEKQPKRLRRPLAGRRCPTMRAAAYRACRRSAAGGGDWLINPGSFAKKRERVI